jgi:[NiFe] hydrogenase diaphorase moiety small subunit
MNHRKTQSQQVPAPGHAGVAAGERVTITIDGREIETEPGRNLVQVANEHGVFIPSLCYFPDIEPPLGTCRVCTCRINGVPGPACTETVSDGMVVEAISEELTDARKAIVEMMFSEGNHFCPGCQKSGDCDLQHMGYELGVTQSRFPHVFKDRLIDFNPKRMIMEHNRCIKCLRCVKEVFTDDGKAVFSFRFRGNETRVGIDNDEEARLSDQQAVDAMHLCPTGAIIVRGVEHARPFGKRRFDLQSVQAKAPAEEARVILPEEKKTIATISLAGCFGCHMSLLDIDLKLLDLVEIAELNRSPLNDIKQFTKQCDIGLIEGGCCNADNVEVLREFRQRCDVLVAVGECAIWGGLPAMRNTIPLGECLEEAYLGCISAMPDECLIPYHEDLPKILDKVYACSEVVDIDYFIPGCPPDANHIWKSILSLLSGQQLSVLYSEFKYD